MPTPILPSISIPTGVSPSCSRPSEFEVAQFLRTLYATAVVTPLQTASTYYRAQLDQVVERAPGAVTGGAATAVATTLDLAERAVQAGEGYLEQVEQHARERSLATLPVLGPLGKQISAETAQFMEAPSLTTLPIVGERGQRLGERAAKAYYEGGAENIAAFVGEASEALLFAATAAQAATSVRGSLGGQPGKATPAQRVENQHKQTYEAVDSPEVVITQKPFEVADGLSGEIPRGKITGDARIVWHKARLAKRGDISAATELKVAKQLRLAGHNVHFIDDRAGGRTNDFAVDSVQTDVKRISGLGRNAAGDLAKGVRQVGPDGQVIVVRPRSSKFTLEQYQGFVDNFTPQEPGVTFRILDESSLPSLSFE